MLTLRQLTANLCTALQTIYDASEAQAIAGQVFEQLLGLTPLQRRMRADEPIGSDSRLAPLPAMQTRLLAHEPLQYVLGIAHFAGLELEVTPATLIPRPETEELVALIIREQQGQAGLQVLDVGTGSGCIPLALATQLPGAHFTAVDVSAEALAVARRNAARYGAAVDFQQVDILQANPQLAAPLHVLVSNPPYVLERERLLMRQNVLAYEPATALFVPDQDPLLFYRRIAHLGRELLLAGGVLYFEINEQYATETKALLYELGYSAIASCEDIFGRPRLVRAGWQGKKRLG